MKTANFKIEANGNDITNLIRDRLESLTVHDAAGIKSDTVTIELDNRDNAIALPNTGAELKVWIDCLTSTHAIGYDFGPKWAEAIGQSLGYAFETNKKAGIVLILRKQSDYKYWIKLNSIIDYYNLPIDAWKVEGA